MRSVLASAAKLIIHYLRWLISWSILGLFIAQMVFSVPALEDALSPLWERSDWSYEDKMRDYWGSYFDLMEFVKRQTPEDSTLLLDPY